MQVRGQLLQYSFNCIDIVDILTVLVTKYFAAQTKIFTIFNDYIYPYRRFDVQVSTLPALEIYISKYNQESPYSYYIGEMNLDILLPTIEQRELLTESIMVASSLVTSYIRNSLLFRNIYDKLPWILELGDTFEVDNRSAYTRQPTTNFVSSIKINFKADILVYKLWLQDNGYDVLDPCALEQRLNTISFDTQDINEQQLGYYIVKD